MAGYKHVRLVTLLGWAEDDNPKAPNPFALVFELLPNGSLADWLRGHDGSPAEREGGLSSLARMDIALGVAAGLGFLHGLREEDDGLYAAAAEAGVSLHRDVKSANVGLGAQPGGGSPYAKILDCGLAKAVKGGAAEAAAARGVSFTGGLTAGTPGYMAPETANGARFHAFQSETGSCLLSTSRLACLICFETRLHGRDLHGPVRDLFLRRAFA